MKIVELKNLSKSYGGKKAVADLSFAVESGEILGLIGPNGAGKSTTIKTILDFIKPDSGDVVVFGGPMNDQSKNLLGYLPEERGLYKKMAAIDLILYLASLKGMDRNFALAKADDWLNRTGMFANKQLKIAEMSKGMGQLIQLVVTIIHDPQLIILDEPFSGLDPVNSDLLRKILAELRDDGKAIILSTHQMNEVEELCDRILMINKGRSVLYGSLAEIKSKYRGHSVLVETEGSLGELTGVKETRSLKDGFEVVLDDNVSPQDVLKQVADQGIIVNRFEVATPSLNEIFLTLVGNQDE